MLIVEGLQQLNWKKRYGRRFIPSQNESFYITEDRICRVMLQHMQ